VPRRKKASDEAGDTARFERRYAPAVVGDLAVLRAINARLVDAALVAVEDLAFGLWGSKTSARPCLLGSA
jgi:hypothetical protein